MDWRDKRLTIRLWYRDLAERRPSLVRSLQALALILLLCLAAYWDVADANSESSFVENLLGAFAYLVLIFFCWAFVLYLLDAVETFVTGLHKLVVRWVWRPAKALLVALTEMIIRCVQKPGRLIALAIAGTTVIWGAVWFLTHAVSFWPVFLTFVLLSGIMNAAVHSMPRKKIDQRNTGPVRKPAGTELTDLGRPPGGFFIQKKS